MIKYETLPDNENLVRAYSDKGVKIHGGFPEGDYNEAIDPVDTGRIYKETDIKIETTDGTANDGDTEATIEDYQNALKSLGVNVDEKETA